MPDIECRIAESMVTQYINHSLSVDELEEFLDHISHCSSCYDELETYFIVHEAIQQLDEPEDGSALDFRKLLDQDIRNHADISVRNGGFISWQVFCWQYLRFCCLFLLYFLLRI